MGTPRARNRTGERFYRVVFIRPLGRRPEKGTGKGMWWELRCDCGNLFEAPVRRVITGHRKSCGCLRTEENDKKAQKRRKHTPIISSARSVWRNAYRDGGLEFEVFLEISQHPCYYCGRLPHRVANSATSHKDASKKQREEGNFTYNGLDRIDNTQRHTSSNVVPCCWDCNVAKADKTLEEFLDHIEKMYEHTKRLR